MDVVMLSQVAVLDQLVYRLLALLLMPTQFFFLAGRNKIVQMFLPLVVQILVLVIQ